MNIKGTNGNTILSVDINQGAILKQELMKEHYIMLPFTLASPIYFKIGSYVDTDFGRFILKDAYKPTRNNTNAGYDYQLRLDAWYYLFANKVVKFMPENDASETTFELTANISTHVQTVMKTVSYLGTLSSLYKYNGTTAISTSIDSDISSEAKYIKYDSVNVIDAFTQIAEAFDCEWWFVDNVLFFGKCERGNAVTFTHLSNVIMTSSGNKQPFANRIIAFGSERNLPHNYRGSESIVNGIVQKRLMLPESTCPNGYIQTDDVTSESEVVEIVRVYDYVYPKTDCEVSSVTTYTSTVENEDGTTTTVTFYRVKDGSGFDFSTDLILEGETLHIIFQSGLLNGMDFECHYNDQEKYYEVIVNENYGIQLPNETLHPAIGDKFILTGWDATQMASTGIIEDAEEELYTEASKDLAKLRIDPNNYNCDYLADENHTVFPLGQKVELVNPAYFTTTRLSRIIGYEIKLDIPYDHPMYIVGESVAYNRLGTLERMIQQLGVNGALLNEYNTRNWQSIVNYTNLVVGGKLETIQNQLDNVQVTYFCDYVPSLSNEPASTWASSEYSEHDGDMFYNRTTGKGYEFTYNDGSWGWIEIQDEDIRQALYNASIAQDTADGKRRVFVTPAGTLPTPPYDENDLWVNATYPSNSTATNTNGNNPLNYTYYNDILKCVTPREEGDTTANIGDWRLASKYTDDSSLNAFLNGYTGTLTGIRTDITNAATAASNAQTSANNASSAAEQAQAAADALDYLKQAYLADNTLIDHGLILSTVVALRDSSNNVWSGISGAYDSTKLGNGIAAWFGGGMIDKEVSAVSNAAKSLFRFDGTGYLAGGNIKWNADGSGSVAGGNIAWNSQGQITKLAGQAITATSVTINGSAALTQSSADSRYVTITWFNQLFQALTSGGSQIQPNASGTIASIKSLAGLWTEQFLSSLGMNSQGGGGGGTGTVTAIKVATNTYLDPDSDGIIDMSNYVSTSADRANWNTAYSQRHTHSNKSVLDGITSAKVTSWDNVAKIMEDDADAIINKWDEVIDFLDGIPDQSTLAEILAAKANTSTTVTNVAYASKKLQKTINGTTTDIVTASTLFSDGLPTNTTKNYVLAAPSNAAGTPTFRALVGADIPDLSATYATASRATTLEGYFTNGVAKTAAKLNTGTTTYTAWGQTYWSSGVPQSISGNMTSVGSITPSANGNALGTTSARFNIYGTAGNFSGNVSIGGTLGVTGATTLSSTLSVASGITLTTTKKIYFGDTSHYLELNSTGFHFSHGVYSDGFVSALGANSSGGGSGGVDLDAMWASLMNTVTDTYASSKIATAHIPNLAASIITSGTLADARIPSLAASKITSGTFDTARIPNLDASKITSGTLAAARIPIATASAVGGIKVGTTLAISDGVLNQKSGIATAGTYRSVTVDTYGRVTAGTNPTTLSGYGITNAYTKTQVDNALSGYLTINGGAYINRKNYSLDGGKAVRITFNSVNGGIISARVTKQSGSLVLIGNGYGDGGIVRNNWVQISESTGYFSWCIPTATGIEKSVEIYNNDTTTASIVVASFDTDVTFTELSALSTTASTVKVAYASDYLPLSGGTMAGTLTTPKIRINTRHSSNNKTGGIYYYDGTTDYLLIGQGSANLWIGANETAGTHHTGDTYISAGSGNAYISRLVNNTRNAYLILDSGNTYVSSGKGYINGTEITTISGNAATATKATQDGSGRTITSTYLPLSGGTLTGTLYTIGIINKGGTATPIRTRGLEGGTTAGDAENLFINNNHNGNVYICNGGGNVGIGNTSPSQKLHVSGNILASGEVTAASDERKKNIISNTKFNVKDIASARSIIYEWNDGRDDDMEKKIHGGSIAQDWLGKADSFLMQDEDGFYSINYGALALCSAITIARMTINHEDRIALLEKENAKLKARVAELEERRIA